MVIEQVGRSVKRAAARTYQHGVLDRPPDLLNASEIRAKGLSEVSASSQLARRCAASFPCARI